MVNMYSSFFSEFFFSFIGPTESHLQLRRFNVRVVEDFNMMKYLPQLLFSLFFLDFIQFYTYNIFHFLTQLGEK